MDLLMFCTWRYRIPFCSSVTRQLARLVRGLGKTKRPRLIFPGL